MVSMGLKTLLKPNSNDCTLAFILESGWLRTSLSMSGFRDKQCTLVNTVSVPEDAGSSPVPEIIDTVFAKTSPIRSFSMTKYERFGLVFTKTRVYKFGHRQEQRRHAKYMTQQPN
jgi:hypothetical protein